MKTFNKIRTWAWAGFMFLLFVSPVFGQVDEEEKKNRWVLSYALVGLLIGLSIYSICRGTNRHKKNM